MVANSLHNAYDLLGIARSSLFASRRQRPARLSLAGKGLIVGAPDAGGKFTSRRSTIATLREEVIFFSKSRPTTTQEY